MSGMITAMDESARAVVDALIAEAGGGEC